MSNILTQYDMSEYVVALAVASLTLGSYPKAPRVLIDLLDHELVRWLMLSVLIHYVGGKQDIQFTAVATGLVAVIYKVAEIVAK